MNWIKSLALVIFVMAAALLLARPAQSIAGIFTPTPPPQLDSDVEKPALEAALLAAAEANQTAVPAFLLYRPAVHQVELSADRLSALVWMALLDPQTNQPVATEPGLALARRADLSAPWQITLPTSGDYLDRMQAVPEGLLSPQKKALFQPSEAPAEADANQVYTGYLLPWEGGKRVWLTGSVAHFTTYNSCSWVTVNGDYHSTCRYAFDFADGTMFRIMASKGGSVVGSRWTCADNDHNCLNYIALEDTSTTPTTTAIYLHLAYNSIPTALRTNGTYVNQGDFIGLADNTGLSTGHHLHFMVVANRWWGTSYGGFWWGDSVDILFQEVDVNGGRPRLCSEAYYTPQYGTQCHVKNTSIGEYFDNWFISYNYGGAQPPTATISSPAAYTTVTTSTVALSGSASDNTGVSYVQVMANAGSAWVDIGPRITANPFNTQVDLCAAGLPNGPVTLAVAGVDVDGNRSNLPQDPRPIYKNVACAPQPPACTPAADQVALYTLTDYQGTCKLFTAGKYDASQLSPIGDNQVASLQVGANVMALLYDGAYSGGLFHGRSQAFLSSDPGLGDNRTGLNTVSSLEVKPRAKPEAPYLRSVYNRTDAAPTSTDSLLLLWKTDPASDEGGTDYRAELTLPDGSKRTSDWQEANSWSVGSLAAGSYTWKVTARNLVGETSSASAAFSIAAGSALGGTTRAVPYTDAFDTTNDGWTATGLWRLGVRGDGNTTQAWGFTNGTNYADPQIAAGDLTSPPVAVPVGGAVLTFRSGGYAESGSPYWDQRRVQISVNDAPFQDLLQMVDDPQGEWQKSPFISLAAYAGKTVRIRFYFNIVDPYSNAGAGWWIDDVSISATGGDSSCAEAVPNDTPASATPITLSGSVSGVICPVGDADYYSFTAQAGAILSADVIAKAEGSALDPYLQLIDSDGKSILAENDDIQYMVVQDSHIGYTIQRSGTYYLKVKAYNHMGVGGSAYTYRLEVKAANAQVLVLAPVYPLNRWITNTAFDYAVSSSALSGVTRVDLYWHNPNWRTGVWELLGSDTTASDGWKAAFDPTGREMSGSALMARAYDAAGQVATAVIFDLQLDNIPPASALQALPATTNSTAIHLTWTGSDTGSGVARYDLEYRDGAGSWTPVSGVYTGGTNQAYFLGMAGHTYGFRLRAVDRANNGEAFPDVPEAGTTVAATCSADSYDTAGDNFAGSAPQLAFKATQQHNICPLGDKDWLRFTAQAGKSYMFMVNSLSGGAAASVAVTDSVGTQVLASKTASGLGQTALLLFTPPADGEYRVVVFAADGALWGTDARYSITFSLPTFQYIPMIGR